MVETIEMRWPRKGGRHVMFFRDFPDGYIVDVCGYIAQGKNISVLDAPPLYSQDPLGPILKGVFEFAPDEFRRACELGYEARFEEMLRGFPNQQEAFKDENVRAAYADLEFLKKGENDVFVCFGGRSFNLPRKKG